MNLKPAVAELFGTFGLALAVLVSVSVDGFPVATPVVAGLTLGLFVYTIGPISGCHINPAVTLGLASIRQVDLRTAISYIVAQFLGAALAIGVGSLVLGPGPGLTWAEGVATGGAEGLGALVFLFGIVAVVLGRVPASLGGVVIGGSLTLGILLALPVSNAALNPAVAFALGSTSLAYVWGPVVGAVAGAVISRELGSKEADAGAS